MSTLTVSISTQDDQDKIALFIKLASDQSTNNCRASECLSGDWTGITTHAGEGSVDLPPGTYLYRYQASGKADNVITVTFAVDGENVLRRRITIGSVGETVGCAVIHV